MELCGLGDISLVQCNLLEVYFILCSYSTIAAHWSPNTKLSFATHSPRFHRGVLLRLYRGRTLKWKLTCKYNNNNKIL